MPTGFKPLADIMAGVRRQRHEDAGGSDLSIPRLAKENVHDVE
jgi:hypothetical protein